MNLRSGLDSGFEYSELVKRSLIRRVKMLFCSPAVLLLSIYMAIAYGILYVLFTTFTFVFEQQYHFSPSNVGLAYIPIGIGMILSMSALGIASDRIIKTALERKEILTPEHRLPYILTIPSGLMLPIGLFIYGWTSQFHAHWAIPLFGTVLVGAGLNGCMVSLLSLLSYLWHEPLLRAF
jgi:predicted MFS family arabinose efflux permease